MKDEMKGLNLTGILIGFLGFLDAAYLTISKVAIGKIYCADIGDCSAVNNSPYAEIMGIPIALLGAGAYLLIMAVFWAEGKNEFWQENAPIFLFVLTLSGVIYSAYLTYVEIAVLHQICIYCVISAGLIVSLFGISIIKVIRFTGGE